MAVNKVVFNGTNGEETLIDLTNDSVTPETLAAGETAHDASGAIIIGMATPITLVQETGNREDAVMSQKAVTDMKDNMIGEILTLIGTPIAGAIDENNVITLGGELAEGTYTLRYLNQDEYIEIGTLTIGEQTEEIKNWLNFGTTEVGGTEIYNGKGWKENTRWSASGNAPAAKDNMWLTGIVPVTSGDVVYTYNLPWISSLSESVYFIRYYSNGNIDEVNLTQNNPYTADENNVYSFSVPADVVGVRFSCFGISDNSMITVNQYPLA